MRCSNSECPYWHKGEECPAAAGCAGVIDTENKQEEVHGES